MSDRPIPPRAEVSFPLSRAAERALLDPIESSPTGAQALSRIEQTFADLETEDNARR